ncbi:MAG: iron-sulfur cluster assembly scaffold protein [Candidatus Bathyarchaeia archaeon]|nr:iron-sulfur cluster assembly scaffold protein [Candidatus Bathyarchaeota archaeon]
MTNRIPLPYNPKVLELFKNPKNLGKINDANAQATAGSLACGDMISIYLKIVDEKIVEASFESYGCAANIAAASIMTEMVKEKTLKEAWQISWRQISDALGGLPAVKYHCGVLAIGALRRAIRAYFKNKIKPDWLPEEPTSDEKHALEEEKLMEILSKRIEKTQ